MIRVRELLAGLEAECSAPCGTDPFPKRVTPCSETGYTWVGGGEFQSLTLPLSKAIKIYGIT